VCFQFVTYFTTHSVSTQDSRLIYENTLNRLGRKSSLPNGIIIIIIIIGARGRVVG
jgi:hypothetical protein